MGEPVAVQLGLYGGEAVLAEYHVVEAHTRVLPDGTTTFVSEHLRWNRGRQPAKPPQPRLPTAPHHPSLFGGAPTPVEQGLPSSDGVVRSEGPTPPVPAEEVRGLEPPGPGQLSLW